MTLTSTGPSPFSTTIKISGRNLIGGVGDELRQHAEAALNGLPVKYFNQAMEATVTFSRTPTKPDRFETHIHLKIGRSSYEGVARHASPYSSFNAALEHAAKQVRRHKRAVREDKPVNASKQTLFQQHSAPVPADAGPPPLPYVVERAAVSEAMRKLYQAD